MHHHPGKSMGKTDALSHRSDHGTGSEDNDNMVVKLGVQTEMSGPKLCKALASTCRLHHSLDGCLRFRRSGWSRRVWSRAEKKLKKDESELRRSRLLS